MENEKRIKNTFKKCSNCGSNFVYSPKNKSLLCKNCGSLEAIDSDPNINAHNFYENIKLDNRAEIEKWKQENKIMKCENCGATIMLDMLDMSTTCPYCGSPTVSDDSEFPGLKPDATLPFAFDGADAAIKFRENIKKKWFLPNKFKKMLPRTDMLGTYIPCFSLDSDTITKYKGTLSYQQSRRTSQGRTEYYTVYKNVSGTLNKKFENLIIESSSQLSQKDMESIKPYHLDKGFKYNQDFIRGFSVDHYDKSLNDCDMEATNIMKNAITKDILRLHNCDSVQTLDLDVTKNNYKYKYFLLPIYSFKYKYKEKDYNTLMNGQTAKIGSNVPRSAVKITFFVLGILLLVLGGVGLYYYLTGSVPDIDNVGSFIESIFGIISEFE